MGSFGPFEALELPAGKACCCRSPPRSRCLPWPRRRRHRRTVGLV